MTMPFVLVAEDEALLQLPLEDALAEAGYDFIMCSSGIKAMVELEHDATRFKALLTDIRLGPGPSGWDLAHRARELVPALPVVYTSGDSVAEWTSQGVPGSVMLAKPYAIAQLVIAISQLITAAVAPGASSVI